MSIKRDEYRPSDFCVAHIDLLIQLDTGLTSEGKRECQIVSSLKLSRREGGTSDDEADDLVLNAEALTLTKLELNGTELVQGEDFSLDTEADLLTVFAKSLPPSSGGNHSFTLTSSLTCHPELNLQLQGLFCSSGVFCTQMEAEGFRRMAPSLDRPDVLSTFKVRLEAPKDRCPVLLSNGNLVEAGDLDSTTTTTTITTATTRASSSSSSSSFRHFAVFEDPHPKPSYLFAVVAGPLWRLSDSFTTMSGKEVKKKTHPTFSNS
jgi:aminopeptidase N